MSSDPKSPSRAPSAKKNSTPPGASYSAEKDRIDPQAPSEPSTAHHETEFPQTAAARPHTVTDEALPEPSVRDEPRSPDNPVEMPAVAESAPPPADSSTP